VLAARGWRAPEEDHLGHWLRHSGGGFTGRANLVLVVGDPGVPLPAAVDAVLVLTAPTGPPFPAGAPVELSIAPDDAWLAG
jgi:hypothetical protein